MRTCEKCLREYEERLSCDDDPAQALGTLFLDVTDPEGKTDLCPVCREEAGILTLLGFGQ